MSCYGITLKSFWQSSPPWITYRCEIKGDKLTIELGRVQGGELYFDLSIVIDKNHDTFKAIAKIGDSDYNVLEKKL
jgi:hypothetical protein